jgi:hypothetical protein
MSINVGMYPESSDFAIAEVLVYNRTLKTDEITTVETYLKKKYGLTGAEMGSEIMRLAHPTRTQTWVDSTLLPVPFLPMTSATSVIQGETYVASASSDYGSEEPWHVFNQNNDGTSASIWTANGNGLYNADGTYAGSVTTNVLLDGQNVTYSGEWVQLECPRAVSVDTIRIKTLSDELARGPEEYVVVGSNDGSLWYQIFAATGRIVWTVDGYTDTIDTKESYSYWRLIVTRKINGGDTWCSIEEFGLFSRDSRRATLVNQPTVVTQDALEYVEFDGSTQYADIQLQNPAGAWAHSVSFWMRPTSYTYQIIFFAGSLSYDKGFGFELRSDGHIRSFFYGNDVEAPVTIKPNEWHHICISYDGGNVITSRHMYMNSVDLTLISQNNNL